MWKALQVVSQLFLGFFLRMGLRGHSLVSFTFWKHWRFIGLIFNNVEDGSSSQRIADIVRACRASSDGDPVPRFEC